MRILVTGGAGFIGSALVRFLINNTEHHVINVDKLTYAGNLSTLNSVSDSDRYIFEQVDICNSKELERVFDQHQPEAIMHLAAESHVDRSIHGPADFINTNVIGTFCLLECARKLFNSMDASSKKNFRFHHISTDEVYGDLDATDPAFSEENNYEPSSPYSASKASSDHLVRAWYRTYGLPILLTNCSNNYGPFHFPEKLIPQTILNALAGKDIPVYGDGKQIRDWLYVEDHVEALYTVITKGHIGETYNIGGCNEYKNIDVVNLICETLTELTQNNNQTSDFKSLIKFVKDRPGHDLRYAIDATKIGRDLNWQPKESFETGLRKTVQWFLDNDSWCKSVVK